jgi:hypothetical protein
MLLGPISRSPDLQKLRDDGYDIAIQAGYLLLREVPYVKPDRTIGRATLISTLDLSNDQTVRPSTHVVQWTGEFPCDSQGAPLANLGSAQNQELGPGLVSRASFSQKPPEGYADYHQKMTSYARMLGDHAQAIDAGATARTYPVIPASAEESVFRYLDTASSRAGIAAVSERLQRGKIAIVGLGGTGGYVLDLVSKTPIEEIHLYDADPFLQHNAFRSPGAPSESDLGRKLSKVEWFAETYSKMRRNIVPHGVRVTQENLNELFTMDFVFLCLDSGTSRQVIADALREKSRPFVDVGMGLQVQDGALSGLVRTTTFTPGHSEHLAQTLPGSDGEDNEYAHNIQVAELNAMNAAFAVVKWKKLRGFYVDVEGEHQSVYGIPSNLLTNDAFSHAP